MDFNALSIYVLMCGAMTVAIAYYAWRHSTAYGARSFSVFMLALSIYIIGYAMELASVDLAGMLFWSKVEYIGILGFPVLFLVFAAQYAGRGKWLSRRSIALLCIIPAVLYFLKLFDGTFHLIYADAWVETGGVIPLLGFARGSLYLLVSAYNMLLLSAGNLFLLVNWRSSSQLYRRQAGTMVAAALFIYIVYLYYLTGMPLVPGLKSLDINPFSYTLWGLAIGWAIFRYRLFDLAPIARDALIEVLHDGVVVLDGQARVADANPEARRILAWGEVPAGLAAVEAMPGWIDPQIFPRVESTVKREVRSSDRGADRCFEVSVSSLKRKDGLTIGFLIVIHDITERKEIERRLRESSLTDELTGLHNRRGFKLLADQLLQVAQRMRLNAVLFYIDLDGLKWINDVRGHAAGDRALTETGDLLRRTFRSSDVTARLGGDEFVVLAVESDSNSGKAMRARLEDQCRIRNGRPEPDFRLSLSVGDARFEWQHPGTVDRMMEAADQAMYRMKKRRTPEERRRAVLGPDSAA